MDAFEGNWDCIGFEKDTKGKGRLDDPSIKAIHYTRMEQQLHLKYAIPRLRREGRAHWYTETGAQTFAHPRPDLQALFDTLYQDAIAAGYSVEQYRVQDGASERKGFAYSAHLGAA